MSKIPLTIARVSVKNGFTLSEVREIRKKLRHIYDVGDNTDKSIMDDGSRIIRCFIWESSAEGTEYWNALSLRGI